MGNKSNQVTLPVPQKVSKKSTPHKVSLRRVSPCGSKSHSNELLRVTKPQSTSLSPRLISETPDIFNEFFLSIPQGVSQETEMTETVSSRRCVLQPRMSVMAITAASVSPQLDPCHRTTPIPQGVDLAAYKGDDVDDLYLKSNLPTATPKRRLPLLALQARPGPQCDFFHSETTGSTISNSIPILPLSPVCQHEVNQAPLDSVLPSTPTRKVLGSANSWMSNTTISPEGEFQKYNVDVATLPERCLLPML